MALERYQIDFIAHLVMSGALKFAEKPENYFKLKSGRMSPYFCNMAAAMDSGSKMSATAKAYAELMHDGPGTPYSKTYLHGPAMKGIALAAIIADEIYQHTGTSVRFGFDFKDDLASIRSDTPIGKKLAAEKPGIRMVDKLTSTLANPKEYTGLGIQDHVDELCETITENFSHEDFDSIVGKAYGGIVPAALLTKRLYDDGWGDFRFGYDRISAKEYGVSTEKFFVGDIRENDRVLVIDALIQPTAGIFGSLVKGCNVRFPDDVITTGKAKRESRDKVLKVNRFVGFATVDVGVHRAEVDETGQSVEAALAEMDLGLTYVVSAPQMFEHAHTQEIDGAIRVDEAAYKNFLKYMEQYGAKA